MDDPDHAGNGDKVHEAGRLDVVRIFARNLQALDLATEVRLATDWRAVTGGSRPTATSREKSPRP
jgi:hypothetical protein